MAKARRSSDLDYENRFRVCGIHVERAALWIALFTIVLDAFIIVLSLFFGKWGIGVIAFLFLLINCCLLAAKRQRHRFWYWPYLVTNAIGLLLTTATIILLIYNLIELPDWWMNFVDPEPVRRFRSPESTDKVVWTTAVLLAFFVLYGLLYSFFQYVVWKAFNFMKKYPGGEPVAINPIHGHDHGRLITGSGGNGGNINPGTTVVTVVEEQTFTQKV
ncbi:hypothetical protein Ddc_16819 [Ditylenchus destructor]|nr:hypothetical protein Ddc_16819 [Ditylenchus destructor]